MFLHKRIERSKRNILMLYINIFLLHIYVLVLKKYLSTHTQTVYDDTRKWYKGKFE